jgi:hypothetical protein
LWSLFAAALHFSGFEKDGEEYKSKYELEISATLASS